MIYTLPHVNKIYEAMTAIADNRISITSQTIDLLWVETITASVQTSSRDKSYTVTYQPTTSQIMSNDNSAYRNDEISYPMIALLMIINQLPRDDEQITKLANIHWKTINTQYKNNRDQSTLHVLKQLEHSWIDLPSLEWYTQSLHQQLATLKLSPLWPKIKPSSWIK
jgi:hypothetical protein